MWAGIASRYTFDLKNTDRFTIILGKRGRVVLQSQLRKRVILQPGDRLIVSTDDEGGFRVVSARAQVHRLRGLYRDLAPGRSFVEELITERREETRREDMG